MSQIFPVEFTAREHYQLTVTISFQTQESATLLHFLEFRIF